MTTIATVPFRHRADLASLDVVAERLGGVRGSVEYRPCYQMVNPDLLGSDARYVFVTKEAAQAFAVHFGGTVDEQTSCAQVVTILPHPQCDCDRKEQLNCVRSAQADVEPSYADDDQ